MQTYGGSTYTPSSSSARSSRGANASAASKGGIKSSSSMHPNNSNTNRKPLVARGVRSNTLHGSSSSPSSSSAQAYKAKAASVAAGEVIEAAAADYASSCTPARTMFYSMNPSLNAPRFTSSSSGTNFRDESDAPSNKDENSNPNGLFFSSQSRSKRGNSRSASPSGCKSDQRWVDCSRVGLSDNFYADPSQLLTRLSAGQVAVGGAKGSGPYINHSYSAEVGGSGGVVVGEAITGHRSVSPTDRFSRTEH